MPVETRAMRRAREAQSVTQTAAVTTIAPRASRKKAAGPKGAEGTKNKSGVKGKRGVKKVQKGTKISKSGTKAVEKRKKKGKGKQVADESEEANQGQGQDQDQDPDPESEPEAEAQTKFVDKGKAKKKWTTKVIEKGKASAASEREYKFSEHFTRADLRDVGALESDKAQMPTLTNDIHPIWDSAKFRFSAGTNTTERAEAYAAISPALRLASLWIEQPVYEEFWDTLWHGQYLNGGGPLGSLLKITPPREDQARNIKSNNSGERVTWKDFRDLASLRGFQCEWRFGQPTLGTWAITEEGIDGYSGCVTTLHHKFERLARFPRPNTTTSKRLRFYFFLALHLSRELVQQVCTFKYRKHFGHNFGPLDKSRIFWQLSEKLGLPLDLAWEDFMFKGTICQINSPKLPTAPDGLAVHHVNRVIDKWMKIYMPVRVDWISERFAMEFWSADSFDEDRKLPGLPDGSNVYARGLDIG